ncbi:MAG: polymer-forming cytoskeletal protein [Spirochaetales bacterium]|nr:polymer-forming cytoskeletal protein [Spirochaetales bacterium]
MNIDVPVNSTIGEESVFEGRYAIKGSLKIEGKFEGDSLLVDQLLIGAKGRVKTDIIATSVVVEGLVIGNISASRRILLLSTARVLGNIKTPELIIQEGVVLEGKCTISHMKITDTKTYIESLYNRTFNDETQKNP